MWIVETCVARGPACQDCVITVLLGAPGQAVDLDPAEQAALTALADSGLVPPLRLIPGARPVAVSRPRSTGRTTPSGSTLRFASDQIVT